MNEWQAAVGIAFCCLLVYGIAFYHGVIYQRRLCERAEERMRRIDPPDRPAGLPTNVGAEPSNPVQAKWRTGNFKSGPPQT